ncbi:MAG: hypothetical protein J1E41_02070 [Ruminococcus sp.]|nr:hypothetical protein [Ruminococcus sp.]
MLKIQNKSTKRIRVVQIVLFIIQIFLTSEPYVWGGAILTQYKTSSFTVLDMITNIGASTGNAESDQILSVMGICYTLFLIIPIIALGFQLFDREYNLKNVVGIICSFAGVICIMLFVGGNFLCLGSLIALLLYLVSAFMSVMGIFARYLKTE